LPDKHLRQDRPPLAPALAPAPENPSPEPSTAPLDPDLARVAAAWPELPKPIRRAILALVESEW
jgi:hypothetical protein